MAVQKVGGYRKLDLARLAPPKAQQGPTPTRLEVITPDFPVPAVHGLYTWAAPRDGKPTQGAVAHYVPTQPPTQTWSWLANTENVYWDECTNGGDLCRNLLSCGVPDTLRDTLVALDPAKLVLARPDADLAALAGSGSLLVWHGPGIICVEVC